MWALVVASAAGPLNPDTWWRNRRRHRLTQAVRRSSGCGVLSFALSRWGRQGRVFNRPPLLPPFLPQQNKRERERDQRRYSEKFHGGNKSRLCWEVELILLSHWLTRLDFWRKPELLHPRHVSEYGLRWWGNDGKTEYQRYWPSRTVTKWPPIRGRVI
jgi:hypothetical protein